jgi:CRISPR-associated protein Csx17
MVTRHVLRGPRPEPLASYLAGLGLIRVLGEQADSAATAAWTPDGLALTTTVTDIAAWLADEYVPTPVLSPWNSGSGFGVSDRKQKDRLRALSVLPSRRLDDFREAMLVAEVVGNLARARGWIKDGTGKSPDKRRAIQELRNRCPDSLLLWIDAAVVLSDGEPQFPPILGSGGNDGRLDFSTNFHQSLLDVLSTSDKGRRRSVAMACDMLAGTEIEQLADASVGQFNPGSAGGPGSSRFGAADARINPWGYVLLVEGALLFAASSTRRHQHAAGRAAMPFTVADSPDGTTAGSVREKSHGEVWVPLWSRDFTLPEIKQLFAEARASWHGRPARRAVDFYAATRTLGVARGIDEFVRYGLHQRNGRSFTAVPLARIEVREQREVRLAADVEDWASLVSGGNTSAAVGQAKRRFEAAHLEYARDGGALGLARMLAALTSLEQAVGRSGRARDATYVRHPPDAKEFLHVLAAGEPLPELRIAVGIASCATLRGTDREPSRTMRQILLPIDPPGPAERNRVGGPWRDSAVVPGFGLKPLGQVLADVLIWRSRTAAAEHDSQQKFHGVPTFRSGAIPVPASDLHALASGLIDEVSLDFWLRACLALDWLGVRQSWAAVDRAVLVPALGLLQPLAIGLTSAEARKASLAGSAASTGEPESHEQGGELKLALRPDWAARLAAGQIHAVHAEAVTRLRQAGWNAVPAPPGEDTENGTLITAALVPRCLNPWQVLRKLALPIPQPNEHATSESNEPIDPEEQT